MARKRIAQVVVITLSFSCCIGFVFAADSKVSVDFRCEKIRNAKLKDLKEALIENCDLNRPFSIAGMDQPIETSFSYCCHQKK